MKAAANNGYSAGTGKAAILPSMPANSGRPFDAEMQRSIVATGLDLLESAREPGTTVQTPYVWSEDTTWKRLVLTKERPFMAAEQRERWMRSKEKYRELKREGKV